MIEFVEKATEIRVCMSFRRKFRLQRSSSIAHKSLKMAPNTFHGNLNSKIFLETSIVRI